MGQGGEKSNQKKQRQMKEKAQHSEDVRNRKNKGTTEDP